MSLVFQKKADGTLKAWVVSIRRNSKIYTKYFRPNQQAEAQKYHDELLLSLPPITRSGPKKEQAKGRPRRNTTAIKLNGCIITKEKEGRRCSGYCICKHYNNCLTQVAKRDWPGFTNQF